MRKDTAILVVSFGTTHIDALESCIHSTEKALIARFADYPVYRAFTSGMVIKKLTRESNIQVDTLDEALDRIEHGGFERAVILPTLLISGIEYELIKECVRRHTSLECEVAKPLLCCRDDCIAVARLIMEEYPLNNEEALVLMGHGTTHSANAIYGIMQSVLDEHGFPAYLTTVEGSPDFTDTVGELSARGVSSAVLLPFLFVAGEHTKVDMAGAQDESLASLMKKAGINVKPVLRGLGELEAVRARYAQRATEAFCELASIKGERNV